MNHIELKSNKVYENSVRFITHFYNTLILKNQMSKTTQNTHYHIPKIIAEIGCNHLGKIEIAKELILLAKNAGAECVKFQCRGNNQQINATYYEPKVI